MNLISYTTLFFTALLAATLIPSSSEAFLVFLLSNNQGTIIGLLIVATMGNTLGSCINWWLGVQLEHYRYKPWFPITPKQLIKAQVFFQRYGYPSLLLSWLPIIGDPLTIIAGVMKMPFKWFVIIILLAKGTRYALLISIFLHFNQ